MFSFYRLERFQPTVHSVFALHQTISSKIIRKLQISTTKLVRQGPELPALEANCFSPCHSVAMLTSTYILICESPQLRGHMPATSAQDGVTGQQAGMRHHGCKLNEVIALGGCKIMGSSLESSGLSGLTVKFNHIPLPVSDFILQAGIWFQL